MEEMSNDWFTGFIEGEGNFHVSLIKNFRTKSWGHSFSCYPILQFRIFLREDDEEVLKKIKNKLGIGKIYKKDYSYARKKGINSRDQAVFSINSIKELLKLQDILRLSSFHTKKEKDKDLFFKILNMKINREHLTEEGINKIILLANQMNSQNRKHFRVKDLPVTE